MFDRNKVILNEYINMTFRRHSDLLSISKKFECDEELLQIRGNAAKGSLDDALCTVKMFDYGIEVMKSVDEEELAGMAKERQLTVVNIVMACHLADDEFKKEEWRQVPKEERVAFFYEWVNSA
jgi:hypothetical protein